MPNRRTQLAFLIAAPDWATYQERLALLTAKGQSTASSSEQYRGEPAVRVQADRVMITALSVRAGWVEQVPPAAVVSAVLSCTESIRAQRPRFAEWSSVQPIDELEYLHDRHVRALLDNLGVGS